MSEYLQSGNWGFVPNAPRISRRRFFTAVGYTPHAGQEQIHAACATASTVVVPCGARLGKTLAAAHEMAFQALLPRIDFMGWCVAPTHVLANLVFDTTARILRQFLGHKAVRVSNSDGIIEFQNLAGQRSRIMRRSTDNAGDKAKLVGYAVDFLVVDEASAIFDESIWENQLRTRLIDRKGRSLHISTPRGTAGYFPKLFRMSKDDSTILAVQLPTWMNPYVDKLVILAEKERMPERAFRQEYGAEFIAADGLVFDAELLERCASGRYEPAESDGRYVAACDLAISNDYTVLGIGKIEEDENGNSRLRVVSTLRFRRIAMPEQLARIKVKLEEYGHPTVNVDATGIGIQTAQFMRNEGIDIRAITWTVAEKRDMVNNAVALVERRQVELPQRNVDPIFYDELSIYGWHETENTHYPTARAPQGAHDDYCSMFIMLCKWLRAAGTGGQGGFYRAGGQRPSGQSKTDMEQNLNRPENAERGIRVTSLGKGRTAPTRKLGTTPYQRRSFGSGPFHGGAD